MRAETRDKLLPYMADVINIKTDRRPKSEVLYVGRGGVWGNKWRITSGLSRDDVLHYFLMSVITMSDDERKAWLEPVFEALRDGKVLGCYCAPLDCHGMIVSAYARYHWNLPLP